MMWTFTFWKKLDSLVSTSNVVFTNCCTTSCVTELDVSITITKSRMRFSSRYSKGSTSGMLPYSDSPYV